MPLNILWKISILQPQFTIMWNPPNDLAPDNLYIIGNGFDRHHELMTSYQAFAFYLQDNDPDTYDLLIKYYNLPHLDRSDEKSHKDPLWSYFEKVLSTLDVDELLDEYSNYQANPSADDFRDREWHAWEIEMNRVVDQLTTELCEDFRSFILEVEFPDLKPKLLLDFLPNAVFLNFNYTDTIERYYSINKRRILYVHGKAPIADDPIILGHGVDPHSFMDKEPTPPEGLTDEQLADWYEWLSDQHEYSYDRAREATLSYFFQSHKSTAEIITNNTTFFAGLKTIQHIFILGHSLANVDMPYFVKVANSINLANTRWTVTYYSDDERTHREEIIASLGVPKDKIQLIKMDQLKLLQRTLFDDQPYD